VVIAVGLLFAILRLSSVIGADGARSSSALWAWKEWPIICWPVVRPYRPCSHSCQLGTVGAEERGALLEGWILTLLRAHNEWSSVFDEIFCWAPADADQTEVDFLLRRGRDHLALEIKSQRRFSPRELSGLKAIANLPRLSRRVLGYLGDQRLRTDDGVEIWPLRVFLDALETDALWP